MSLDRIHQFIKRHEKNTTFVFLDKGIARCVALTNVPRQQKVNRIMLGFYPHQTPIGFYNADVNEQDLAQDLRYCGVET